MAQRTICRCAIGAAAERQSAACADVAAVPPAAKVARHEVILAVHCLNAGRHRARGGPNCQATTSRAGKESRFALGIDGLNELVARSSGPQTTRRQKLRSPCRKMNFVV